MDQYLVRDLKIRYAELLAAGDEKGAKKVAAEIDSERAADDRAAEPAAKPEAGEG